MNYKKRYKKLVRKINKVEKKADKMWENALYSNETHLSNFDLTLARGYRKCVEEIMEEI